MWKSRGPFPGTGAPRSPTPALYLCWVGVGGTHRSRASLRAGNQGGLRPLSERSAPQRGAELL